METTIDRLISTHLQTSGTYLSLGFFFRDNMSVKDLVHFSRDLSEEKHQGAYLLLLQNQHSRSDLISHVQMLPSYQCGGSLEVMETSLALKKNLNQVLMNLLFWLQPTQTSNSATSWRSSC